MKIGRLTLSDRASQGVYEDKSGPAIDAYLGECFDEDLEFVLKILPDDQSLIEESLIQLSDHELCSLIITTGGTGPSARDVTPEATIAVLEKELPGFGEVMRTESFKIVKTAILSRATAGIRGKSLIINLPGNPKAVRQILPLLLAAIAECLEHLTGSRPKLSKSF
ncbi:MAG: molybdopterin adenylyltransferase [Verrucomicrobiota bacterium]